MSIKKNPRVKVYYKQLLKLKNKVQFRNKLLKFKKYKWHRFVFFLKKSVKRKKKPFKIFDQLKYTLTRFKSKFAKRFKNLVFEKKKIKFFYGNLGENKIKKSALLALNEKKIKKNLLNSTLVFLESFEKRLDMIIYRSSFISTIRFVRQLILHNNVLLNKKFVTNQSYKLKQGDIINFRQSCFPEIEFNLIFLTKFRRLPPKYLHINYKIFQIIFYDDLKFKNISLMYPFHLKLNKILTAYDNKTF